MEDSVIISGVFGIVAIVVFFVMANNINKIKKHLELIEKLGKSKAFKDGVLIKYKCNNCSNIRERLWESQKPSKCAMCKSENTFEKIKILKCYKKEQGPLSKHKLGFHFQLELFLIPKTTLLPSHQNNRQPSCK